MPHRILADKTSNQEEAKLITQLFEAVPVMMGLVEVEGDEVYHLIETKASSAFTGRDNSQNFGRKLTDLNISAEQTKDWAGKFRQAKETGQPVRYEHYLSLPEMEAWIRVTVTFIRTNPNGRDLCCFVYEDISERKQLIRSLETERERFHLALEGSNAGLYDWDLTTNNVFFSKQWKEMLGYDQGDLPNNFDAWKMLIHPEDKEMALKSVDDYIAGKTASYRLEHRLLCKDGSYRWILSKGACTRRPDGKVVRMTGWHIDIHELRSTVEELKRRDKIIQDQQVKIIASAKMSSLGEMAGGIAHEINNPLAIIALSATQIGDALNHPPVNFPLIRESLQKIGSTVQRIGKIVKGLRSFSRSGENDPFTACQSELIVGDTLELCRERFRSNGIDLRVKAAASRPVQCRPVQISQVLLNLLNNALDAVKDQDGAWAELLVEEEEGGLRFTVIDSGAGISSEVSGRMMDPFFTTKEIGEGTGLGLSIAKGIVEDHGSDLRYSLINGHTSFSFSLPFRRKP